MIKKGEKKIKLIPFKKYFTLRMKNARNFGWKTIFRIHQFENFMKAHNLNENDVHRGLFFGNMKLEQGEYKLLPYSWKKGVRRTNGRLYSPLYGKSIHHFNVNDGNIVRLGQS